MVAGLRHKNDVALRSRFANSCQACCLILTPVVSKNSGAGNPGIINGPTADWTRRRAPAVVLRVCSIGA